jgi:hypothetical protein
MLYIVSPCPTLLDLASNLITAWLSAGFRDFSRFKGLLGNSQRRGLMIRHRARFSQRELSTEKIFFKSLKNHSM